MLKRVEWQILEDSFKYVSFPRESNGSSFINIESHKNISTPTWFVISIWYAVVRWPDSTENFCD
jgi:hypothetical protein